MRVSHWVSALAFIAGCQSGGGGTAISDADKQAIRDQATAFGAAVNAKDWAAAAGLFTDDAIMMPSNGPEVSGKANIEAWMAGYPTFSNFTNGAVEVEGHGDLAYARGTYEMDVTMPGMASPMHDKGKWLEVLRKQADGSWKTTHDIFNSDLAMTMASPMAGDTAKKP